MDQVINISWRTTSGATLGGFKYEYDAAGRIVSRSHALGDQSHPSQMSQLSQKNYDYDDLDRLASDGDVSYTYDAAGNRMTRTEDGETITYTRGVGDRLASWTGGAYSYDAAGNVTHIERDGKPTLDLTWNSQYQLVSVSTNGVFAEGYAYDALCRRVSTTTANGTTRHVYDSNWQVIADLDEDGGVVASYTWDDGIDNLLAVSVGGATYYPLTDIQGTVWGYVDSQNNVVARWQYDTWGNVVDEEFAPNVAALATIRYRFQCREWSAATGLVNFRMRWYDPETVRCLSKDPIGLSGGINLYAFCDDDGVNKLDCAGTSWFGIAVKIGKWGVKITKRVSKSSARRLYREKGADICGSKQAIKKLSKKKGYAKPKIEQHGDDAGRGTPHYHPTGRETDFGKHGGHGFVTKCTAVGLFGDHWYTEAIDFFNPMADINDVLDLIDELSDEDGKDSELDENDCLDIEN